MFSYEECKNIALNKASAHKIEINRAYKIGSDYAFDNSEQEYTGILPTVVDSETGKISPLWYYLGDHNLTMDDMVEMPF